MRLKIRFAALALGFCVAQTAVAGDYNGNFMVRLQGTQVITQDSLKSLTSVSGAPVSDLKGAGFDAEVSDRFLPITATFRVRAL